jgi:hypothetical protein
MFSVSQGLCARTASDGDANNDSARHWQSAAEDSLGQRLLNRL